MLREPFDSSHVMDETLLEICSQPVLLSLMQNAAASIEEMSFLENYDPSPHSPAPSVIDRQELSPESIAELRAACAVLAGHINPHGHENEEPRNHREPEAHPHGEQVPAKPSSQGRTSKSDPQRRASGRRHDRHPPAMPVRPNEMPPNGAAAGDGNISSGSLQADPVDPTHLTAARTNPARQGKPANPPARIGVHMAPRPIPAGGAIGHRRAVSHDTSHATSGTPTTGGQPASTRLSSWASATNEKRSPPRSGRRSDPMRSDHPFAFAVDGWATAGATPPPSRPHTDPSGRCAARPGVSATRSDHGRGPHRPGSRAGAIAESVKGTIRDCMRPRPSADTLRATRSETTGGSPWWRGAGGGRPRRGGSCGHLPPEAENPGRPGPGGPPNLNRDLPPLPGLDQYRERTRGVTHIAQLMRTERVTRVPRRREHEPIRPEARIAAERIRPESAVRPAEANGMRPHPRVASLTWGFSAPTLKFAARGPDHAAAPSIHVTTGPVASSIPAARSSSSGFRHRWSRFLHPSRGTERREGIPGEGNTTTVN